MLRSAFALAAMSAAAALAIDGGTDAGTQEASKPRERRGWADVLYQRGVDLADAKKLAEARDALETCLVVAPEEARCHKALGGVYAKLNDPEKGLEHYREYLR